MDDAMEFMSGLTNGITAGINNCILGKIERFDGQSMKADIIPMVRSSDGGASMLIEVPVSFIKAGPFLIRPPYKKGDVVVVMFADNDIENVLLSGEISDPNSNRKHSLDDAIAIGSIMPFTKTLPDEHLSDLVIAKDDFSSKIVIKESGDIIIEGGNVLLGDGAATEGVPLGDTLKNWLDTHTHPSVGAPTSQSPSPSEVVKIK